MIKIRESNGTFKVEITSLAGQELTICRENPGSFTFELREAEDVECADVFELQATEEENSFELERVPVFATEVPEVVEECAAKAAPTPTESAPVKEKLRSDEDVRDDALFRKLSDLRRSLASAENVPPYMIFHDKTLHGMVEKMPAQLPELGKISGVGKAKLEKYGVAFLSALKQGA